jgi:zinc/manganese transport system substrate-binding protein
VREIMSAVPAGECRLVTGHESLGYFADRYGCELIGAVIPSLSSTAETSAKDLSELLEVTKAAGVRAIFTEVGTPQAVAEQVAAEVGVPLVELPSHNLPETGGYQAFVVELATKVAAGLTGAA